MKNTGIPTAVRSVISVHARPETTVRLSRLAETTRRSKSFLANEAIERYLELEEQFVAEIEKRMLGLDSGQGVSSSILLSRFNAKMCREFAKKPE